MKPTPFAADELLPVPNHIAASADIQLGVVGQSFEGFDG